MHFKQPVKTTIMSLVMAGVMGAGITGVNEVGIPTQHVQAASAALSASQQALNTLNSFYKPALKGQFPGDVTGLTVGQSTKQELINKLGQPSVPGKLAEDFDLYHAEMGHPGYGFSYKLNKIHEMRYFGTNIERQTNIGGITMKMLKQNWGASTSTTVIKNGSSTQTKLTYKRGQFKLEFIFNTSTDLDHINLLKA